MNRITIVDDDKVEKQIRILQAELIKKEHKNFNFSFVVNQVLSKKLNRKQYSEKYKLNKLSKPKTRNKSQ